MEDLMTKLEEWGAILRKHHNDMDNELLELYLDMAGYSGILQSKIDRLEEKMIGGKSFTTH
ncbi:hypothetical protein SAMN05192559_10853 [Halobacillus karajensis]|uniref:hypothetical protein n=1 Tax=Halobacillus karajensis TaxID=195088 RepID=UPI0008A7D4C7|nr:hypothetical protein [Halobacillus karajensis]SEI04173.1 hypothetical protein SAMN05192559_10853 [Halobacillus karajensis]